MSTQPSKPCERAPSGSSPAPWFLVWGTTLALTMATLGAEEIAWRNQGVRPTVPDSKAMWAFWRDRVYRADGRVVVCLGTSRIRAALSEGVLRERLPDYRVVQLGINSVRSPLPVLEDLAHDSSFRGTVLCEMLSPFLHREQSSSGQRLRLEERFHARKDYWDALSKTSSASWVHFQDFPALSALKCEDGSHLDQEQSRLYTSALVEYLLANKVVEQKCAVGGGS